MYALCFAFTRFWYARRGTAAIEFAIIAPILFTVFLSTIEFGMLYTASAVLENAASHASRFGLTGAIEPGRTREESVLEIVKERTTRLIDADKLYLTTKVYEQFNQIGQEEPYTDSNGNGYYDDGEDFEDVNGNAIWDEDMATSGAGGAGDIVIYTVNYDWPLIIPMVSRLVSEDGIVSLRATVIVRNEPFDNVQYLGG